MKRVALALVIVLLAPACSLGLQSPVTNRPQLSAIGKTAVYGRQFVIAGNGVLTGIDTVMENGVLPREHGITLLRVMQRIGDEAVRLADILKLLDQATTATQQTSLVARAQSVVATMRTLLDSAILPIADTRARAIMSSTTATFSALLSDFGTTFVNMLGAGTLRVSAEELSRAPAEWRWAIEGGVQ